MRFAMPITSRLQFSCVLFGLFCVPLLAHAERRITRVAAGAWSDEKEFGSPDCPGSYPLTGNAAASLPLDWGSFRFHGSGDTAYTNDTYCQYPPEPSLQTLVGANTDDSVTAIRYTWLSGDFVFDGPSFQWTFFTFPNSVTIVALYGLVDVDVFPPAPLPLDGSTAIKEGTTTLWSAAGNNFDGEYFCFIEGEFAGLWNGELDDTGSACLEAATIFDSSFE